MSRSFLTLGAMLTAVAGAPVFAMSVGAAATAVAVTVNATAGLSKIPPDAASG